MRRQEVVEHPRKLSPKPGEQEFRNAPRLDGISQRSQTHRPEIGRLARQVAPEICPPAGRLNRQIPDAAVDRSPGGSGRRRLGRTPLSIVAGNSKSKSPDLRAIFAEIADPPARNRPLAGKVALEIWAFACPPEPSNSGPRCRPKPR